MVVNKRTKFIIRLNSGLVFTSFKKPVNDGNSISFVDRNGLFKSFNIDEHKPTVEEVFI